MNKKVQGTIVRERFTMSKKKVTLKVGNFGEDIHKYTRKYIQLKKQRDKIDKELNDIREFLIEYIDNNKVEAIEDRYYRVLKSTAVDQRISKDKFVDVYGSNNLPKVCNSYSRVQIRVTSKVAERYKKCYKKPKK